MKIVFLSTLLYILGAGRRKMVPRFLLMELFLQTIKLCEINKYNDEELEL